MSRYIQSLVVHKYLHLHKHKPGTRNNRQSVIKDHAETTDHDIDINHVQILEKNVDNWYKRIVALHKRQKYIE